MTPVAPLPLKGVSGIRSNEGATGFRVPNIHPSGIKRLVNQFEEYIFYNKVAHPNFSISDSLGR